MNKNNTQWYITKTGMTIFNVQRSNSVPNHWTAISEHGKRLHFPESFILREADHAEVAAGQARLETIEDRRTQKKLANLRRMGFHVIHK